MLQNIITTANTCNRFRYQEELVHFINKKVEAFHSTHYLYLMTTRFIRPSKFFYDNYFVSQHCFRHHNKLYLNICSTLVSNHTRASKKHLLPISFDFIDDTRSKSKTVYQLEDTPHMHSIVFVRNQHCTRFESCIADNANSILHNRDLKSIESVHTERITNDLKKTIRYASKLLLNPVASTDVMLYTINPRNLVI
jgi:hypothetical protein